MRWMRPYAINADNDNDIDNDIGNDPENDSGIIVYKPTFVDLMYIDSVI